MNSEQPDLGMLVKLQSTLWYIFIIYYSAVTAIYFFDSSLAESLTYIGIMAIIGATLLRVIALSETFRRSNHPKYMMLSYLLFVIMLSSIFIKFI